jgi:spermidine synthase
MGEGVRTLRMLEDGPRRFVLRERDGFLELLSGSVVLLSSAALETERTFGRLAAQAKRPDGSGPLHVLVGGLGFGMTVRGVLDVVAPGARVTVAEKVDAVERLVRGELAHVASVPLGDDRVRVVPQDVGEVIAGFGDGEVDAILLDVDNGPGALTRKANDRLYDLAGLGAAYAALRSRGVLAAWSAGPDGNFTRRLHKAGFEANEVRVRARGTRGGARQIIWIAVRSG